MHLKTQFLVVFSLAIALSGCGSKYPPVSGTVTVNGKPVSKIEVVFAPKSTKDTAIVGPVSFAITDSEGRFSLRTKGGDVGAVAGQHAVGFRWCDVSSDSLQSLKRAHREVSKTSPVEAAEIAKRIDDLKRKLKERPKLPEVMETEFELTPDGTLEANFELTEFFDTQP